MFDGRCKQQQSFGPPSASALLCHLPQSCCCPIVAVCLTGEKLSESRASDVRELCNTLLSAYLIQLLDTGLLHADPHPGNLIRTNDGKICVLDFGLMTEVTPEQRIALVEYIAHLTTQVGATGPD